MTSSLLDRLVAAGFEPDAARTRLALLQRADEGLRAVGAEPAWRWLVPGRLEVFGKHTDYAGGRSLIAAVPRGFAVVARPREDDVVRVTDARNAETTVVGRDGVAHPRRGWATYVSAVVQRLSGNFRGASIGVDIAFASDLPRAAGVSSSSALLVGIATALVRRGQLTQRPEWRRAIASPLDLAGYLGCIENGRTFRSLAGTRGVGTHGGSEDHTAILLARPGVLRQFSYTPVSHEADVAMPAAWRFVVASSGVHADKAGTVRDRYNRAARLAALLLSIWNRRASGPAVSLGAAFAAEPNGPERLVDWLQEADADEREGVAADDLRRRLQHFLKEDARVTLAVDAFRRADAVALGTLAAESQADATTLLENQVPETVALVDAGVGAGARAVTSFGAGFGGSAWAIVEASCAESFGEQWVARYRRAFPEATRLEWFTAIPAPSLLDVSA